MIALQQRLFRASALSISNCILTAQARLLLNRGNRSFCVALLIVTSVQWSSLVNSAAASCGDYLFRHGKPVAQHTSGHAINTGLTTLSSESSHSSSIPDPVPCTGPHCSRRTLPSAPVEAPLTIRSRNSEQATVADVVACLHFGEMPRRIPESEHGAFFEPNPLFRPPDLP